MDWHKTTSHKGIAIFQNVYHCLSPYNEGLGIYNNKANF